MGLVKLGYITMSLDHTFFVGLQSKEKIIALNYVIVNSNISNVILKLSLQYQTGNYANMVRKCYELNHLRKFFLLIIHINTCLHISSLKLV